MSEALRYVVDASVVTKWHLRDEDYAGNARRVLEDFREGRIALLAPDHIRYEVASGIRNEQEVRQVPCLAGGGRIVVGVA